jgi:hypothetical protein
MTSADRLTRLAQPTNNRRQVRSRLGEGDPCVTNPAHGRMFVLRPSDNRPARQWCASQSHDMDGSRAFWPADPVELAKVVTQ